MQTQQCLIIFVKFVLFMLIYHVQKHANITVSIKTSLYNKLKKTTTMVLARYMSRTVNSINKTNFNK